MLTAYLDESGHETKGWMFVAGFLGNDEQWKQFVPLWREALGPQREHLHMADLRWKKQRTRELLARLGAVPDKCKLTAVVGGVRQADYDDLIQGTPAEKLLKGYIACIYPLVINVLRAIPKNERLEIVFEQQREYEWYTKCALSALVSIQDARPDWFLTDDGLPKLAKWTFVPKGSTTLIEPADYFVYALRNLYQDKNSKQTQWCKPILDSGNGKGIGAIMKRKAMREQMMGVPFMTIYAQAMTQMGRFKAS